MYNLIINLTQFLLKGVALFNTKIKKGVLGRKQTFNILEANIANTDLCIWLHCASLGEYEQGLPVFNEIRKLYPNHKIVLTFFSPSGYEIRKNTAVADLVVYLPLDTKPNAKRFVGIVNPTLTVFVKYDIWPNYLATLKTQNKRAILISALFRENQTYFKGYGKILRNALFAFEHIFVQDNFSKQLLNTINYKAVTVSGDTRFDRVYSQLTQNNELAFVANFKQDSLCVVAGSTWQEDELLLIDYINNNITDGVKFIIAPHNIKASQIQKLKNQIHTKVVCFSEKENKDLSQFQVLILDTIGLLTKVYRYADIAYVGGAMGRTGLHNTLEPAVFGIPIIIGKEFNNFPEAKAMLANKGLYSVSTTLELTSILSKMIKDEAFRETTGMQNIKYIKKNTGAVIQIINYLRK